MAIVWEHQENGNNYQVRAAGKTRRLYTNGVFHSQYHPNKYLTGSVWDLLFLPALFKSQDSIKRILVLGVGGGAVVHTLQRFFAPEEIIGIELDPVHLKVARDYFSVNHENTQLLCADALAWIKDYNGEPFDLIIDDVFTDMEGEPKRVRTMSSHWFERLNQHRRTQGMLILNFVDREGFAWARSKDRWLRQNKYTARSFSIRGYDNRIICFGEELELAQYQKNINLDANLSKQYLKHKSLYHQRIIG